MTDTTVKIFTSSQVAAPVLNNAAGSLIALLDSVLVTGFGARSVDSVVIASGVGTATIAAGSPAIIDGVMLFAGATGALSALNGERKVLSAGANAFTFDAADLADGTVAGSITAKVAAAGWVKAFSGTNLAAYKSSNVAASGHLLRVDDSLTTGYALVRGYKALTDINTGTDVYPTTTQQANSVWYKANATSAMPWIIVANDRTFYIGIASQSSYPNEFAWTGYGDFSPDRSGDANASFLAAQPIASGRCDITFTPIVSPSSSQLYAPKSFSGLGSPVSLTRTWLDKSSSAGSGLGAMDFPNRSNNALKLSDIFLLESSTNYRGTLPGIYATPQASGALIDRQARFAQVAGINRNVQYMQAGATSTYGIGGFYIDVQGPWSY